MMLSCGQMMCALRHNGRLQRLHHFRRSRNIIAQHIICRAAANLIAQRAISMFCTNGAFSPCEKCEKYLSIKSVMCEDATKIYLNKESAPCSLRQKAVCFKQAGQRPAQKEKARNTM
jgi:hypothetical protein